MRIILDVQLTPDGHLEGALRMDCTSGSRLFHGIIELAGLLEECLGYEPSSDRQPGISPAN